MVWCVSYSNILPTLMRVSIFVFSSSLPSKFSFRFFGVLVLIIIFKVVVDLCRFLLLYESIY